MGQAESDLQDQSDCLIETNSSSFLRPHSLGHEVNDIGLKYKKQVTVVCCPHCNRYLQPPYTWVKSQLKPQEILALFIKNLKSADKVQLASITEQFLGRSQRCEVTAIRDERLVNERTGFKKKIAEYVIDKQICESCSMQMQSSIADDWMIEVRLVYTAPQKKLVFKLLETLYAEDMLYDAVCIQHLDQSIVFYFILHSSAIKFENFVARVVPLMHTQKRAPLSTDGDCDAVGCKISLIIEIFPVHSDDLVLIPKTKKLGHEMENFGPVAVCIGFVNDRIGLLDPVTFREFWPDGSIYTWLSCEILLSSSRLVAFKVLSVKAVGSNICVAGLDHVLADAEVARAPSDSDVDADEAVVTVRTNLGGVLSPGDYALGYDLNGFGKGVGELENLVLPNIILVKKLSNDHLDVDFTTSKRQRISDDGHTAHYSDSNAIEVLYGKRRMNESTYKTYWDDINSALIEEFLFEPAIEA